LFIPAFRGIRYSNVEKLNFLCGLRVLCGE
jgi:hypothetical protein